jgi:hypothetical protein
MNHFLPLLVIPVFLFFSQPGYELVTTVKVPGEQHYSDPFGNIYVVHAGEIKRFDNEYREAANYSNSYLGKIYSADLSDPLRILLYFKDYNQILWLDKYLVEIRSPLLLDQMGFQQVDAVCSSSQGGFWLYNDITCQIHYFDNTMNLVHESINLRSLLGSSNRPVGMLEKNRNVYLNVPATGILIFDRFGNYRRTLPVTGCTRLQVTDTEIFFFKNDSLFRYNIEKGLSNFVQLPGTINPVHAEIQPGYLYLFSKDAFYVYRYKDE